MISQDNNPNLYHNNQDLISCYFHVTSLTVNGVILIAKRLILTARMTHTIAITSPSAKTMLNVIGLG